MYIHCCQEALVTSGSSSLSYAELMLPLPQSRRLWEARSSLDWKMVYLDLLKRDRERAPSFVDVLADPSRLKIIGDLYDHRLVRGCLIYAASAMIRRYRQDKTVFTSTGLGNRRVGTLADEIQQQGILHILEDVRAGCEDFCPPAEEEVVIHILSMHLFAPFDQIELIAGKEGRSEVTRVYPHLQVWADTQSARQAVWHASQALRYLRSVPEQNVLAFDAIAAYHASICIWVYGVLQHENGKLQAEAALTKGNEVVLDDQETYFTRRWISHGHGTPVVYTGRDGQSEQESGEQTIPISSPVGLVEIVLARVLSRFSGMNSRLVENICCVLKALSDVYQDPEE